MVDTGGRKVKGSTGSDDPNLLVQNLQEENVGLCYRDTHAINSDLSKYLTLNTQIANIIMKRCIQSNDTIAIFLEANNH